MYGFASSSGSASYPSSSSSSTCGDAEPRRSRRRSSALETPEPSRYHATSRVTGDIQIDDDKGYFLWIDPRGTCDLVFRYHQTGYDFNLYIDPPYRGVAVSEVCDQRATCPVYNGKDDLQSVWGAAQFGSQRDCQDKGFRIVSRDAAVRLRLEPLADRHNFVSKAMRGFKINYTMVLR